MRFFNLSNDHLFKLIFSHQKYLKYLLKEYFKIDTSNKEITYLNSEFIVNNKKCKVGIVDMFLNIDEEIILLELQNLDRHDFIERLDFYSSHIKANYCLKKGEEYCCMRKMKALAIINFNLGYKNYLNEVSLMTKDDNIYKIFYKKSEYKIYNLLKKAKKEYIELDMMFKVKDQSVLEKNIKSEIGLEILEKIKMYNLDSEEREKMQDVYEMMANEKEQYINAYKDGVDDGYDLGINEGMTNGYSLGINQGIVQNQTEIIQNMLKEKIDMKIISKVTKLPISKIKTYM